MPSQSLLWTALPNGLTEDGTGLRVSVVLAPRLEPGGAPSRLSTFTDWLDWPATLARATFRFAYGADPPVYVPYATQEGPHRVDTAGGSAASNVWTKLFRKDLLVRGQPFVDHAGSDVLSFDAAALDLLVKDLYAALARTADGHLPTIASVLDKPGWNGLVRAVAAVDAPRDAGRDGPRNTSHEFADYASGRLPSAANELPAGIAKTARLLAAAQLFHTPPSRQVDVVKRARTDDPSITASWHEHAKGPLPLAQDFAKLVDFHQIVGAMSSYPVMLRQLGIVVDFVLARDAFGHSQDAPLTVMVGFKGAELKFRRPDVSPVTHAVLTSSRFEAVSDSERDLRVPGRLLDLDDQRFKLLQMDVDGAGLKVMNFARSLRQLDRAGQRADPVSAIEREVGAPALRTAGLMLVQSGRGKSLKGQFDDNALKNAAAQAVSIGAAKAAAPSLYAEDLQRGFRIDIWDETTGVWRSLCQREATYTVGDADDSLHVQPRSSNDGGRPGEDEGFIRMAATKSPDPEANPDLLWLHEAILSWTGWSLAAPPPGRAIRVDDTVGTESQTEAVLPPGLKFESRLRAARGSLPRLRYGRRYWLRARAVDLAGNSLDPQEVDFGPERPEKHARPFLRYEPVAAPVIALVGHDGVRTEPPGPGESMLRLAIRSLNDTPAMNEVVTEQRSRRFAVPQQVSVREAEQHGMLDDAGRVDASTFTMLADAKDRDATDPKAALVEEIALMPGPPDSASVPTTFAVYHEGRDLTYLPDPLAIEVAVRVLGHPEADPDAILPVTLYPDGRGWPDALPFKIELYDGPGEAPTFHEATRTLFVPLAKAQRATVRLSLKLTKQTLREVMGVWSWVGAAKPQLQRLALDGQHWMLTPWTEVEVVHAVQRPLLDPTFEQLAITRGGGQTSALARFRARCSIASTDRLDLHAQWHEPSDDPAATVPVDHVRRDIAFSIKVTEPRDYAANEATGAIADHSIEGPDLIGVNLVSASTITLVHDSATRLHEFNDTCYRRIEYQLKATTKFREYLPDRLLTETINGKIAPTEKHITVTGPPVVRWIPSSAPPPAPDVLYVVPTFGWTRTRTKAGDASSWRRGGGLRVYLDRPWNVTGYGEMLAVALAPESFKQDPDSRPLGRPYKSLVTQWGNDPIWDSPFVKGIAPSRSSFPLARTRADQTGGWLPPGAAETEIDQPALDDPLKPFKLTGLGDRAAPVDIAAHDVHYDHERQLWYCDIEIDQGPSYWPFIRLALARYQPVSVDGCELSEIVLADVMPLAADRWLHVRSSGDPGVRRVTVHGRAPRDSSGSREARAAATADAATLDGSTVIEVWAERLDPGRGEDFGWKRVGSPGREAPPAGPAKKGAPAAAAVTDFVPAHDRIRALSLKATRDHTQLVKQGLVSSLMGSLTLWDGTVRLPAEQSDRARVRLVIAEYEEYLVDDDKPSDGIPMEKGRRLVFVEHVEMTALRVSCITPDTAADKDRAIQAIGGMHADGTRWTMTLADAIAAIERGRQLYVQAKNGERAFLVVATSAQGTRHLRTTADDERSNNLGRLPDCP